MSQPKRIVWSRSLLLALTTLALSVGSDVALAGFNGDGKVDAVLSDRACLGDGVGDFTNCAVVGGGYVLTGANGVSDTSATGDDAQVIAVGQGEPNQASIHPGFNPEGLESIPGGDDTVVLIPITPTRMAGQVTTGPNGIAETVVDPLDTEIIPFGQGAPHRVGVALGPNSVLDGVLGGDDFTIPGGGNDVTVGDVDGDGNLDTVFAFGVNAVCFGDGLGGLFCNTLPPRASWGVALGDVNGDGDLDAVLVGFSGSDSKSVCLGDGSGPSPDGRYAGFNCSAITVGMIHNNTTKVALGDVNGDGDMDAVFASTPGFNSVCLGDGAGDFACSAIAADSFHSGDVALGDLNDDGNLDAVFANFMAFTQPDPTPDVTEHNRVCLGDGGGGFSCADVSPDVDRNSDVALGDVNGDGNLDAVFSGGGGSVDFPQRNSVCLGDGAGGFTACNPTGTTRSHVVLGDVNGDGNLDALYSGLFCPGDGSGDLGGVFGSSPTCSVIPGSGAGDIVALTPTADPDDGDGIATAIDGTFIGGVFGDESNVFSSNFTDQQLGGSTFGTITDRAGLTLTIDDTPGAGVDVVASGDSSTAQIEACSSPMATFNVTNLDAFGITCSSVITTVTTGPVEMTIPPDIEVSIPTGGAVEVSEDTGTLTVTNTGSTQIAVDGEIVEAGDSVEFGPEGDDDGDGVLNVDDSCPATRLGAVTDGAGCAISDYCPCDADWRNHGAYVSCISRTARTFAKASLISKREKGRITSSAARSDCGK